MGLIRPFVLFVIPIMHFELAKALSSKGSDNMREIRALADGDWAEAARIQAEAYPGVGIVTAADRERAQQNMIDWNERPTVSFYGLFEEEKLLGMMRLHDFQMRLLSTRALTGGVGGVAVALRHKKEKVGRDLLLYFLRHYRQQGACLTALYPFRPDFYKQMGFGFGGKLNRYEIDPKQLPHGRAKTHLVSLSSDDSQGSPRLPPALLAAHQRPL